MQQYYSKDVVFTTGALEGLVMELSSSGTAATAITAAFLASVVEAVEAFTVVLAVGTIQHVEHVLSGDALDTVGIDSAAETFQGQTPRSRRQARQAPPLRVIGEIRFSFFRCGCMRAAAACRWLSSVPQHGGPRRGNLKTVNNGFKKL
jgi:hypothetical protein